MRRYVPFGTAMDIAITNVPGYYCYVCEAEFGIKKATLEAQEQATRLVAQFDPKEAENMREDWKKFVEFVSYISKA